MHNDWEKGPEISTSSYNSKGADSQNTNAVYTTLTVHYKTKSAQKGITTRSGR